MKALLALIVLGTSFSFLLAYKDSYVGDGGYNLICDSRHIFCLSRILVEEGFRRNLNLEKFSKLFVPMFSCL